MDIQTRKLNLIEYMAGLDDENIISQIESIIEKSEISRDKLPPFSREDLIKRAEVSNRDYKAGRFISQEELENDSKEW